MTPEEKDTLFARWLAGDLSPEERSLLEKNGDAETLKKITDTLNTWSLPELKKKTFSKTKTRIAHLSDPKIIPFYRKPWFMTAAAAVALIITSVWFFSPGNSGKEMIELTCSAGETKNFTLPDSSFITLTGNSKLKYNKTDFIENRNLDLQGEAYFEVRKKGNFEVHFSGGAIKVLGTKFTVLSDSGLSSVKCFEGKVEVDLGSEKINLEKGAGVRKMKDLPVERYYLKTAVFEPGSAEERFEEAPLAEVCASISLCYNVSIIPSNVDLTKKFTGRFSKNNLDTALLMVFEPMGVAFKREGNKVILGNK